MSQATNEPAASDQKTLNFKPLIIILVFAAFIWFIRQRFPSYHSIPLSLGSYTTVEVLATYPHDPNSFTQGLVFADGFLYESSGLYGESKLRKLDLESGQVLLEHELPETYFAEGLAFLNYKLYQLTWKENTGFIYNIVDFSQTDTFSYDTEGWGLTTDGVVMILSDGTDTLYIMHPHTMDVIRTLQVTWNGNPVDKINELEYIRGEIYANIWFSDMILRIDPQTGLVLGQIDCSSLRSGSNPVPASDVLNGIAYDKVSDRLFITGKNWPALYEVVLIPQPEGNIQP